MDRCTELRARFSEEPFVRTLAARLVRLETGVAHVAWIPAEAFTVIGGLVQGGATVSVADFAGVYAAMTVVPNGHTPASSMQVSFLRPVFAGEEIVAEARVINASRSRILVSVEVKAGDALKAVATIEFARIRARSS